jgi:hypothetical protein
MRLEGNDARITLDDLDKLRHTVGHGSRTPGYRNRYFPSEGDMPSMRRLEAAGLMSQRGSCFVATKLGCNVAGLGKAATRRALYDPT